jgi:hypothetical protein
MSDPTGMRPEDNPGHCLGYQGDCGIDPEVGNGVRGEYSPEQLESWGVLGWQQPHFGDYRLPGGGYDYEAVTSKAAEIALEYPGARHELESLYWDAFAVDLACQELWEQGACSQEFKEAVQIDLYALTRANVEYAEFGGGSIAAAMAIGIAAAVSEFGVGTNRTGTIRSGGILKGTASGISASGTAKSSIVKVSKQKQNAHVVGTVEYQRRVDRNEPTSAFDSYAEAEKYSRYAWEHGTPVAGDPNRRDYTFNKPVGRGPKGGWQTTVRVHMDGSGRIHGHPKGPEY